MISSILSSPILRSILYFLISIGSLILFIIVANSEKGMVIIKSNLQLYYGVIGFMIVLAVISILLFWSAYKDFREEKNLIMKYSKKK